MFSIFGSGGGFLSSLGNSVVNNRLGSSALGQIAEGVNDTYGEGSNYDMNGNLKPKKEPDDIKTSIERERAKASFIDESDLNDEGNPSFNIKSIDEHNQEQASKVPSAEIPSVNAPEMKKIIEENKKSVKIDMPKPITSGSSGIKKIIGTVYPALGMMFKQHDENQMKQWELANQNYA